MITADLLSIVAARRGHFRYESGHHGNLWLDLDRMFDEPARLRPFVAELAERLRPHRIEIVCGPATGGAVLARMLAEVLGIEAIAAQRDMTRVGPIYLLPHELRDIARGRRVAVVDDAINAASAVRATLGELRSAGAKPVVVGALLLVGSAGAAVCAAEKLPLEHLTAVACDLWPADACPLCAAGSPVDAT
jgi:orotate phosphoribosyltransferase